MNLELATGRLAIFGIFPWTVSRSFIQDLKPGAEECTTLMRGIIALGHNLGLRVVAKAWRPRNNCRC